MGLCRWSALQQTYICSLGLVRNTFFLIDRRCVNSGTRPVKNSVCDTGEHPLRITDLPWLDLGFCAYILSKVWIPVNRSFKNPPSPKEKMHEFNTIRDGTIEACQCLTDGTLQYLLRLYVDHLQVHLIVAPIQSVE